MKPKIIRIEDFEAKDAEIASLREESSAFWEEIIEKNKKIADLEQENEKLKYQHKPLHTHWESVYEGLLKDFHKLEQRNAELEAELKDIKQKIQNFKFPKSNKPEIGYTGYFGE